MQWFGTLGSKRQLAWQTLAMKNTRYACKPQHTMQAAAVDTLYPGRVDSLAFIWLAGHLSLLMCSLPDPGASCLCERETCAAGPQS